MFGFSMNPAMDGMNSMSMGGPIGMDPLMMGLMVGMQMMQMMNMMQMMQGPQSGMCGLGGFGGPPLGDLVGAGMGMPGMQAMSSNFAAPYMGPNPWGGGSPSLQGGSPAGQWSNSPVARPGDLQGCGLGNSIARAGACSAGQMRSVGRCYRGVKNALRQVGVNLQGGSAYQAADQLANNPRFREVRMGRAELRNLPPGAVVVWNRNLAAGKPHGHISIALGGGRESSDHVQRQITGYPSSFRVFLPQQNS